MARQIESQYKDLLNPVKDPEKSFAINISQILQDYVNDLLEGKTSPNFNSAALILQGSASIYGKKVEYLHNLATQLYQSLLKQKKVEQQQVKKDPKEKEKKEEKKNDILFSVEIKIGKNLSCLRKKAPLKTPMRKSSKKVQTFCIPVLITADTEDRGDIFYDIRGEAVGNKGDFAINRCRLLSSGWLILPTVNPNLVPPQNSIPNYDDSDVGEQSIHNEAGVQTPGLEENMTVDTDIECSPDDGFGSYPESNTMPTSTPGTEICSQNTNTPSVDNSAPPSTDEGIGSTPVEDNDSCQSPGNSEGIENVPMSADNNSKEARKPVRQSVRQALKLCQLAQEDDPLATPVLKHMIVRKKIQKKNTRNLPNKLKLGENKEDSYSISEYCARTFFSMDGRNLKTSLLSFDVDSFDQNSKFMKRIIEKIDALKLINRKNKKIVPLEDERDIDIEGIENLQAADDDDTLCVPFEDGDVQIDNDPALIPERSPEKPADVEPLVDVAPVAPSTDISHMGQEQCDNYLREVHQFAQNSDITERVHAWEKSVKPFLDELDRRESFDINLYGSRILNSFEDSNRKQTMTFKQFCRNKEKWEIHRYFMALLPLANIGNVSIESEHQEDGNDQIFVTLLSRKMHHKELEEFGHSDGSHS